MAEREPSARQFTLDDAIGAGAAEFMDLRVPEYAYMFGFLQMDAHLHQGVGQKGRLTLEINARDIEILREFQNLTPYNSTISRRTRATNFAESYTSAVWRLCSVEARTRINQLGLPYGRKSTTIRPPQGEFSRRDYLRGIVDADGSVGYTGQGLPFVALTTASTAIASYFTRCALQVTGAERLPHRNARDGIYNILYTKEAAQLLAADLYFPGCLSLERKRTQADSLATWVRPAGMKVSPKRRWQEREDRVLLEHSSPTTAAEELGRTVASCHLRLWRLRNGTVPLPSTKD